jgi:hypothetical protein
MMEENTMTIKRSYSSAASAIFMIGLVLFIVEAIPAAQTKGVAEQFSANAVDMNTGRTGRIEISVTRWSTPAERETLLAALFEEGSGELLEKLRDMRPVGRIYSSETIGYDLKFAEEQPQPDGGRKIILATDRPMSFRELFQQTRSADYPFTWVQLNMRADGTGQGELAVRARVFGDRPNRPIEVETFEIQPIRLQQVTARKKN